MLLINVEAVDNPSCSHAGKDAQGRSTKRTCVDWADYECRKRGWGTSGAAAIAELLNSCPVSCIDSESHPQAAPRFKRVKKGAQCGSTSISLGKFPGAMKDVSSKALVACAAACASSHVPCHFFTSSASSGECERQTNELESCPEGFQHSGADYYRLEPPLPPPPPPSPPYIDPALMRPARLEQLRAPNPPSPSYRYVSPPPPPRICHKPHASSISLGFYSHSDSVLQILLLILLQLRLRCLGRGRPLGVGG